MDNLLIYIYCAFCYITNCISDFPISFFILIALCYIGKSIEDLSKNLKKMRVEIVGSEGNSSYLQTEFYETESQNPFKQDTIKSVNNSRLKPKAF